MRAPLSCSPHPRKRQERQNSLELLLSGLDGSQLESLLERLEHYEERFPLDHAETVTVALYSNSSKLRKRIRHILDPGTDAKVARVVLRLLRGLDETEVVRAVRAAVPNLITLSDKRDLIGLVGHRDGEGHRLISDGEAGLLEADLVEQVLTANAYALSGERGLIGLLGLASATRTEDSAARLGQLVLDDGFLLALLRAALVERIGQPLEGGAVRHSYQPHWDFLVSWVREDTLRARVLALSVDELRLELDDVTIRALGEAHQRCSAADA